MSAARVIGATLVTLGSLVLAGVLAAWVGVVALVRGR